MWSDPAGVVLLSEVKPATVALSIARPARQAKALPDCGLTPGSAPLW
ncbi:hypothetical protein FTUN_8838 [Frigoriglobus tundricola]|uniref:Uncharacterized protein n=1 Tax=Frigoriglobus tundricola TaxID=2774151 RepID=A0A6M5Z4P4_9BACT|nr:hypothetical protein FTUN_8838 [Frigoriglobus tundricola]